MQLTPGQQPSTQFRPENLITALLCEAIDMAQTAFPTGTANIKDLKEVMGKYALKVEGLPRPENLDCKAGCSACCHLRVSTSIPEVLIIAEELRARLAPPYYETTRESVNRIAGLGNTLEPDWWLQTSTPCPFLCQQEGGVCGIYDLRPFTCRSHHSSDASQCTKGFVDKRRVDIPGYPHLRQAADLYSLAFIKAADKQGLASYEVGFIAALNIAMNDENAFEKWALSEDVFAEAAI